MRKRNWMLTVMSGALLLGATALRSQELPPEPPPGPEFLGLGGPFGGRMEMLGFGELHAGKVVTGAPYSALAVIESAQTLADGTSINRKVQSNVYRDGQGRTRRETTFPGAGPLAAAGQPKTFVLLHDPVAGSAYVLRASTKTAEKLPTRGGGPGMHGQLQHRFEARMEQEIAKGTLKKDDLGTQTINGVSAQGTRYTHTIAAGQIGNDRAITIIHERWYSPDLQIVVKSTRNDPRFGVTTYTLTNIQKQEPAASLFTVPSDYTIEQGMHGRHGLDQHRHGPPADAPPDAPMPPGPGEE